MPNPEELLKQALETLAVTNAIQERHARMIVDHEEWLVGQTTAVARHEKWLEGQAEAIARHEKWLEGQAEAIARHEEWLERHEAAMQALDEKLDRIADLILKGRGGNGQAGK